MTKYILVFAAVFALFGCAMPTRAPTTGFLYTDQHAGLAVSSNQTGNRIGEACATSILGMVGTGDASIEAARRNGGITMISSVDESFSAVLGIYAKHCTIVRGR